MDQDDSLEAATLRKGEQYNTAVGAERAGQQSVRTFMVQTVPLVFGVLGLVVYSDILQQLAPFRLHKPDRVLAAGVRAANAAASTMIDGRKAKLAELTMTGRQDGGRRAGTGIGSRRRGQAAGAAAAAGAQRGIPRSAGNN